jgi:tRNA(fMet)-specific endonuclease VapC
MLDTDTCAFIMRGPSEALARRLQAVPLEEQAISVVTLAELLYGVRVSAKTRQNRIALDAFLKHVSVLDWTEGAAEHYAEIRVHLHKKGQMIGANDLLIAAHARTPMRSLSPTTNESFDVFRRSGWRTGIPECGEGCLRPRRRISAP